jgi:hypothetical protein
MAPGKTEFIWRRSKESERLPGSRWVRNPSKPLPKKYVDNFLADLDHKVSPSRPPLLTRPSGRVRPGRHSAQKSSERTTGHLRLNGGKRRQVPSVCLLSSSYQRHVWQRASRVMAVAPRWRRAEQAGHLRPPAKWPECSHNLACRPAFCFFWEVFVAR